MHISGPLSMEMLLPSTTVLYSGDTRTFTQFVSFKFLRSMPDILEDTYQTVWVVSVENLPRESLGEFEAFLILPQRDGWYLMSTNSSLQKIPSLPLLSCLWLKSESAVYMGWRWWMDCKADFQDFLCKIYIIW